MTDLHMIRGIYKMLLERKWTAIDLLKDVQNVCVEDCLAQDVDEWTNNYCDFLEVCVTNVT